MNFTDAERGTEVLKQLYAQRETGSFCDAVVVVQGRNFHAHKCVLAATSTKLQSLLKEREAEGVEQRVKLKLECSSAGVFEEFLRYLYSGVVKIHGGNAIELLGLAHDLEISSLLRCCVDYLRQCLNIANCMLLRQIAEKYAIDELLVVVSAFCRSHWSQILAESDEPLAWHWTRVEKEIAGATAADPSGTEHLFRFVLRWVLYDLPERERFFKQLLSYLNISYLSSDFISSTLSSNELFRRSNACLVALIDFMRTSSQTFDETIVVPDGANVAQLSSAPVVASCSPESMVETKTYGDAGSRAPSTVGSVGQLSSSGVVVEPLNSADRCEPVSQGNATLQCFKVNIVRAVLNRAHRAPTPVGLTSSTSSDMSEFICASVSGSTRISSSSTVFEPCFSKNANTTDRTSDSDANVSNEVPGAFSFLWPLNARGKGRTSGTGGKFTYLEVLFTGDGKLEEEIDRPIGIASDVQRKPA
ncbi:unnamed protein product [Soboliphyme baturini]|uniref:BTB domain-containing protein n=1 Tax=Soboliphyme baturini TaxID=241478 RepID=A0A183II09_9BILA|nr:unnamed protein product [Soboliphyme baturini]